MIGRENSEGNFEQEWKEAFSQESQNPPPGVWTEIDRKLAYGELSVYKRRTVYYRWAVAAVILVSMTLGAFQYIYFQNQSSAPVYSQGIAVDSPKLNRGFVYNGYVPNESANHGSQEQRIALMASNDLEEEQSLVLTEETDQFQIRNTMEIEKMSTSGLSVAVETRKHAPRYLPVYHFEKQRRKTNQNEKYWAGVSFGSGGFDPNYQSDGNSLLANSLDVNTSAFSLADNEAIDTESPSVREGMRPGETVSLGLNFGLKLSDRWTLSSGVQYARADVTTQTNVVIQTSTFQESIPATSQVRGVQQFESVVQREEVVEYDYRDVNLNNEFQFTSIPVRAGYLIFNDKFKLEVNAGVIANFYMGNHLSGTDAEIAELTIGPGDESPYREVSFSGLAGLEFGYRLMKNFDFIIEPNYRHAINPLTKDNTTFVTNPSGFGLMTGVRYNFN